MLNRPADAGRRGRSALAAALSGLLLTAGTAAAAGTGGVEVVPDPPVVDGRTATNFQVQVPERGDQTVAFTVRNTEDEPRTARVYTAEVTRPEDALQLGSEDSSDYVHLAPQTLTLAPGEVQRLQFTVPGRELPADEVMAAVVVEVGTGSVVQRAATLIYLRSGQELPVPLLLLGAAVLLLVASGTAVSVTARRRQSAAAG